MLKFLWQPELNQTEMYDLVHDPAEANDLSADQQEAIAAMQLQIRKELGTAAPEGASADRAERAALKALGYLE